MMTREGRTVSYADAITDRDLLVFNAGAVFGAVMFDVLPWYMAPLAWGASSLLALAIAGLRNLLLALVAKWLVRRAGSTSATEAP